MRLPHTEDQILTDAQQALDELRLFVRGREKKAGDKKFALQFQLESLEDMLRVVTDSRYARRLAGPGNTNGDGVNTSTETLQYIISTIRNVVEPTTLPISSRAIAPIGRSITSRRSGKTLRSAGVEEGSSNLVQSRGHASEDIWLFRRTHDTNNQNVSSALGNPPGVVSLKRACAFRHGRHLSNPEASSSHIRLRNRTTATITVPGTIERSEIPQEGKVQKGKGKSRANNTESSGSVAASKAEDQVGNDVDDSLRPVSGGGSEETTEQILEPMMPKPQIHGNCRPADTIGDGEISHGNLDGQTITDSPSQSDKEDTQDPPSPSNQEGAQTKSDTTAILIDTSLAPPANGNSEDGITPLSEVLSSTDQAPPAVDDSEDDGISESESPSSPTHSVGASTFVEVTTDESDEPMSPFGNMGTLPRDSLETLMERTQLSRTIPRIPSVLNPSPPPPSGSGRPPTPIPGADLGPIDAFERRLGTSPGGGRMNRTIGDRSNDPPPVLLPPTTLVAAPPGPNPTTPWRDLCVACLDPLFPLMLQIQAPCGHAYCRECGINLVNSYTSQESPHPLRCCNIPIPHERVRPVLPPNEFTVFLQKDKEFKTPIARRVYCPNSTCKQFIKVGKIASFLYLTGKMKCPACSSSICTKCKEFAHHGTKCGADSLSTIQFESLVKQKGWQRCTKCRRVVERTQGCLHMTCLCGHEFCYRCGAGQRSKCGHGVFGN